MGQGFYICILICGSGASFYATDKGEIEGFITPPKRRTRFFKTIGFLGVFYGFFLKTKGSLPKVYEIFTE